MAEDRLLLVVRGSESSRVHQVLCTATTHLGVGKILFVMCGLQNHVWNIYNACRYTVSLRTYMYNVERPSNASHRQSHYNGYKWKNSNSRR